MLPLIGTAAEYQRVLHPDAYTADMKPCLFEGLSEVQPFRIRMENVCRSTLCQMRQPVLESREQELIECTIRHAVVLDGLAVRGFIRHIVRRVRHDEIRFDITHEMVQIILAGSIATQHPMFAQRPQVALFDEGRDLLWVKICIIVLDILVMYLVEKLIHLCGVKAGRAKVIACQLEVGEQVSQRFRLPFSDSFVERNVQCLFVLRVLDVHHHAVDFCCAFCRQHLEPLMAADNISRYLVPDDRVYIAEVLQASFDFFVCRITGLQVLARIVLRRFQRGDRHSFYLHVSFHAYLLQKWGWRTDLNRDGLLTGQLFCH